MAPREEPAPPLFRPEALEAQAHSVGPGEPLRAVSRRLERLRRVRVPYVAQMEITDCGAACLAMTLALHGRHVELDEVRKVTGTDRDGVDALALTRAARYFGLRARGVRLEPEALELMEPGTILHWNLNHFVVLESANRGGATIVDPGGGRRRVVMPELRRSFTGVAVELTPGEDFATSKRSRRSLWRHIAPIVSRRGLLTSVVVSSALIQIFALALPILTASVVDRVIPRRDRNFLGMLCLGLAVMVVLSLLATYLRGRQLLSLRTRADLQISLRFIEHMADLPYAFFLSRSTGDLMMRLNSNATIREILTSSVLSGLLDGGAALIYLFIILARNVSLGLIVLGVGALQVLVLVLARRRYQTLMAENLGAQSRSQAYLAQLLAGMETLKVSGAERRAVETWSNLFVKELNVSVERGKLSALVDSGLGGLRVAGPVAILAWGAVQVLDGQLSLGTMLALSALSAGFLLPLGTLVGNGLQLQSLGGYLARINDVLDTPKEQDGVEVRPAGRLSGNIRLEDVGFRYGPLSPEVVHGVSVDIKAGQMVAIVGRSGSGKSTLANLIVGLYSPTEGRVLHDGQDLAGLEARSVREQVGVVPQSPYLFGASIRDNIDAGDPTITLHDVREAARLARIDDDVEAMAIGFDTPLADGGASLSGGQCQRIALARALVRRPAILVLDEATSELDSITEAEILENLRARKCTRILIAHRLSTITTANQILVMEGGVVVQRGTHAQLMRRKGLYRDLVNLQSGA
ncbi:MAG: peptidase domain-containing ABC transporter [Candidatus Dormibacteria bacterium]